MNKNVLISLYVLKTASLYKKSFVHISKYNKTFLKILNILYTQGFIKSFNFIEKNTQINVILNFSQGTHWGLLDSLKITTKIALNTGLKYSDLCLLSKKKTFYLFLTKEGFFSLSDCIRKKIGGKLLLTI
jgi:ribosomal protein S8